MGEATLKGGKYEKSPPEEGLRARMGYINFWTLCLFLLSLQLVPQFPFSLFSSCMPTFMLTLVSIHDLFRLEAVAVAAVEVAAQPKCAV